MKKLAAIFLLSLFLFNTLGYYFVFSFNRFFIRSEMRSLLRSGYFKDNYVTLEILNLPHNPDFKRIDKNEFRYKGNLYDIISEKKNGNVTVFKCVNDLQEENLLACFGRYMDLSSGMNNSAKAKHARAMIYHVIKLALVQGHEIQSPEFPCEILLCNHFYPLHSVLHLPSSPPPEFS